MKALIDQIFQRLTPGRWSRINLDAQAKYVLGEPNPLLNPHRCQRWVNTLHRQRSVRYSWGGYMEDRRHLWRGHYHQPGHTIHLGIDFNVPAFSHVFLPCRATLVHKEVDPDQNGGWGGKLIFRKNRHLYFILGHLFLNEGLMVGEKYPAGTFVGLVGTPEVNGGWFPHLHLQCMKRFEPGVDGYAHLYPEIKEDFPDPKILLSA